MAPFSCESGKSCTLLAVIAAVIVGVVTAFLQITAVITVTPVLLWVAFGIAVVYLGILTAAAVLAGQSATGSCRRGGLAAVLTGILGTALLAGILLAAGIVATSVFSAILVGLLAAFFTLMLTGAACLILCLSESTG